MLADDHKNQVYDPDDVPSENDAKDARQNFPLCNTSDRAADTRRYGDNREDHAHKIAKTEIIALSCHVQFLLCRLILFFALLYWRNENGNDVLFRYADSICRETENTLAVFG